MNDSSLEHFSPLRAFSRHTFSWLTTGTTMSKKTMISDKPNNGAGSAYVGEGDEHHQVSGGDVPTLTTQGGAPVSDDQNSLKAGTRGPTLLEDQHFREKIFHFDHERIPERVVHARGFGAHGVFETYESLSDITRADLFQRAGEKTEMFVRFSTVAPPPSSNLSADSTRQ